MDTAQIQQMLRQFAEERDWSQFHTPKNLAMALAAEAGELLEVFQWLTPEQSEGLARPSEGRVRAIEELADIAIFLLRLADVLEVDLDAAVRAKIEKNGIRYPAAEVRGSALKRPQAAS